MIVESTRLGQLECSNEHILQFPNGLYGFPDENSFVLVAHQPDSSFTFLQSISEPNLTFIMLETLRLVENYEFELNDQVVTELNLSNTNPPQIFNIVTNTGKVDDMTVNLLSPIVINVEQAIAQQVVLEGTQYKTRHRLFPEELSQMMKNTQK